MTKRILTLTTLLITAVIAFAQNPVHFTSTLKMGKGAEAEIVFTGKIEKGWHVYSTNLGSDGPIEATFHTDKMDGVELVGKLTPRGREISQYDNIFGMKLRYFENSVQFVQKIKFTKPNYKLDCYLEFGACNDEMCMPPTQVELHKSGKSPATAEATQPTPEELAKQKADSLAALAAQQGDTTAKDSTAPTVSADQLAQLDMQKLYRPVVKELKAQQESTKTNRSLWYIFAMGFVGGLLALLTPCVWPIIPMTVSFFLKRAKDDKKKGIRDAITFGPALIVNGEPASVKGASSGLNPRTAIGQRADGAVLMLVIDGRQASSLGATYADEISVLLEYGAINAANLDGGSSSLMYYKGEYLNKGVLLTGSRELPTGFIVR